MTKAQGRNAQSMSNPPMSNPHRPKPSSRPWASVIGHSLVIGPCVLGHSSPQGLQWLRLLGRESAGHVLGDSDVAVAGTGCRRSGGENTRSTRDVRRDRARRAFLPLPCWGLIIAHKSAVLAGPKARPIPAWGNAPGTGQPISPKRQRRDSSSWTGTDDGSRVVASANGSGLQPSALQVPFSWAAGPGWHDPRRWRSSVEPTQNMCSMISPGGEGRGEGGPHSSTHAFAPIMPPVTTPAFQLAVVT